LGLALYGQVGQRTLAQQAPKVPTHPSKRQGYLVGLLLVVASAMTRAWFQVALTTYLPAWVQSNGGTLAQGSQLLSVFLFAIGAGSLLGGFISDRMGAHGPWLVVFACTALVSPAYWLFLHTTAASQILALLIVGIAIGCTYPTNILLAHDAWPHQMALASGLVMGIGWAPGGLGASFTGYMADHASLGVSLQFLLAPPLLGTLLIIAYRLLGNWPRRLALDKNGNK
jgi:MFS family permease